MECPECQFELPDNAKFCPQCGLEVGVKGERQKSTPTPDAERKRVTALFSDPTGYTAMTEKLGHEEVKEITINIFFFIWPIHIIGTMEGFCNE